MADPPRVLVDATAIPADRGGVGRYVDGLVQAADRPGLVVACQHRDGDRFRRMAPRSTILPQHPRIASTALRLFWEQIALPRLARRHRIDVVHSPHYTIPLLCRRSRVVVFHDMTFFSDPALHSVAKRWFFRGWISLSGRFADRIVCDSRATADELSRYRPARRPVDVIHLGVDHALFRVPGTSEVERLRERIGTDSWIGFLGTLEPRKNVPALIRAVRHIGETREIPPLLIAGGSGWDPDIDVELGITPSRTARRLGYLPIEDLPAFLGGAEVVAYPSLGEGFGLPVLEAMACAGVVLTTNRLSLPEVGGDAVAYSEVSEESIRHELEALLDEPDRRRRLRDAAIARAAEFDWTATAIATESAWAKAFG